MQKIFIVAFNYNQYKTYRDKKVREAINLDDHALGQETVLYRYVASTKALRGIRNPHGVFIGNWYERSDARDIVDMLLLASIEPNPVLKEARKLVG